MTLKPARLLLAMIAVIAAPAFAQNVAVVNGKAIPSSRVEALVKQVVAQGKQADSPQLRDSIKKDLIGREVGMTLPLTVATFCAKTGMALMASNANNRRKSFRILCWLTDVASRR